MSEFWTRFSKFSGLIVGAIVVVLLIDLAGIGQDDDVTRIARDRGLPIETTREIEIDGQIVRVVYLGVPGAREFLVVAEARGYRSRFRLIAHYAGDISEPRIAIAGDSEWSRLEHAIPRNPTAAPLVLDALSGATVTADAISDALWRCEIAVRRAQQGRI